LYFCPTYRDLNNIEYILEITIGGFGKNTIHT
jgi:hypothetical protein